MFRMGFGAMGGFGLFEIMFSLTFFLVMGVAIFGIVRGISQWNKNNRSPRLTVPATVVAKRTDVSRSGNMHHHHTSTSYYVTFQVESGDRMEFCVSGQEFGKLVEGDRGNLTFQGTRYLNFVRI